MKDKCDSFSSKTSAGRLHFNKAMEARVRRFLKEAYKNWRNLKFVVREEENESEGKLRSFSTQCTYKYILIILLVESFSFHR